MNHVKIGLEEYDRLKKSHDALRAKKVLSIPTPRTFSWEMPTQEYYTESEVIADLTNRINELEIANNSLKESNRILADIAKADKPSFWSFLKK